MSKTTLNKNSVFFFAFIIFIISATIYLAANVNKLKNADSDILSLLPEDTNQAIYQKIKILSNETVNETIILISNKTPDDCISAGLAFQKSISRCIEFKNIRTLNANEKLNESKSLYEPFHNLLMPQTTKFLLEAKGLNSAIQQTESKLQSPLSVYYQNYLQNDPLLNIPLFIQSAFPIKKNQIIHDDYLLLKEDEEYFFVLQCTLNQSPFNQNIQLNVLSALNNAENEIKKQYHNTRIIKSGVLFFAARGNQIAQKEISTLGISSIVGVLLLLLMVFRSIKPLTLGLLSICCGIISALFVSSLLFDRLHLVTLTFGTSLIGVSIDYAVHFFSDHKINSKNWSASNCLNRILPGISWGAFTTILAFLALALNPLPGLHQIAIFSASGIIGAYLAVILLFPKLYKPHTIQIKVNESYFYTYSSKFFRFLHSLKILLVLFLAIIVYSLININIQDDIKNLYSPPEDLKNNEQMVHKIFDQTDPSRLLVITGSSIEDVLQKEENFCLTLQKLKLDQHLNSYYALSTFLPSIKMQKSNYDLLLMKINDSESKLTEEEKNIWFAYDNKQPYRSIQPINYLTPEIFFNSQFGSTFKKFIHESNGQYFSVVLPIGLKNETAIQNAVANKKDIIYINNRERISDSLKLMREKITISTIVIYILITILLLFKHGLKKSLAIVLIPLISALLALSVLVLAKQNIHIGHFLALIIVLGTGIDYTIFLAESQKIKKSTWVAITVSALTTILSFGLLALCQTEFLRAFGQMVLLGVGFSYLLCPLFYSIASDKFEFTFTENE